MNEEFEFPRLEHPLKNIHDMSEEVMAQIEDSEVASYGDAYKEWADVQREDVKLATEMFTDVMVKIRKLFGSDSKEDRYFQRKQSAGETLVDAFAVKYSRPDFVSEKVRDAKRKVSSKQRTVGCGDNDLAQINDSVKFLIKQGHEFGKDFTAFNAVDLAKQIATEQVAAKKIVPEIVWGADVAHCESCVDENKGEEVLLANILNDEVSCSCGYQDYCVDMALDDGSVTLTVRVES